MTVVEMAARVMEVVGRKIVARELLDALRNKLIENQIAVIQDADGHEAGGVRVVRGYLPQIDVVSQQQRTKEKHLRPPHKFSEPMLTQIAFLLFVLSGFCGLLYQVVWLRLAFGAFGIVTPVLSVVVSVFMLGLALGSWGAGRTIDGWVRRTGLSPIYLYALAELLIGLSAFFVPLTFDAGQRWLLGAGQIDSLAYLVYSGAILSLAMLPPCVAMGATFPLMLAFIRSIHNRASNRFSFLYLGNVLGASLGAAITPLILVERLGFRGTLRFAAFVNVVIALASVWLGSRYRFQRSLTDEGPRHARIAPDNAPVTLAALFITGFSSMAMEVIWTRAFTTVLGTYVYSFAALLFTYLWATWMGSWLYRRHLTAGTIDFYGEAPGAAGRQQFPSDRSERRPLRRGWYRGLVALASIFPFCACARISDARTGRSVLAG